MRNGRLTEALGALTKVYDDQNWLDRILMADVLLNVKGPSHAERILKRAIDEKDLPSNLRAMAHGSLGTALVYRNCFGDAVKSFERAVYYAQKANDTYQISEAQLKLLAAKVDYFGPTAVGTLMTEALRSVQTVGDPHLLALLHYRVAVVEGRRGAMDVAQRHIDLGLDLLQRAPNPWIDCCLHLTACSLAFVSADLNAALEHAEQALRLSRVCGAFYYELASLCNAAQVSVVLGHHDRAAAYLQVAEPSIAEYPFLRFCLYDIKAQLQLASHDLTGCDETLTAISNQIAQTTQDDQSFPQLDSLVTRIKLLHQQGRLDDARTIASRAAATAGARGERILEATFQILHAGLLLDLGQVDEATDLACTAMAATSRTGVDSLTTRADLDHVRGRILHKTGAHRDALQALARSARIHASVGDAVARDLTLTSMKHAGGAPEAPRIPPSLAQFSLIDSLSNICTLGGHPDLLSSEAYEMILAAGVTERLALLIRTGQSQRQDETESQSRTLVRHFNWPDAAETADHEGVSEILVGTSKDQEFVLRLKAKPDFQSRSSVSGLDTLIQMAVTHEQHRREKLRHGSVWPIENSFAESNNLFGGQRMGDVLTQAMKVAKSPLTILLTGETGVGKEVLAREIHRLSLRSDQIFQPVVCAGMPSGLLESQLFGHRKGAFTGAVSDFPGVIRGAQGGTLFLDEIGELTTDLQVKLLRFLESKEIHPLGDLRPIKVDVRIIAATNANLQQLVEDGKFREDLFYRLSVATFNIPPLRERREEILALAQHFLTQYAQQNQNPIPTVSDETLEYLLLYPWPGNVRELRNEMERLAGMTDPGTPIEPSDLKPQIRSTRKTTPTTPNAHEISIPCNQSLHQAVDQLEEEMIRRVLNGSHNNLDTAAKTLGLTRKGLYHKRQRFGML